MREIESSTRRDNEIPLRRHRVSLNELKTATGYIDTSMNFKVFGCPSCEQPFQVAANQAGQIVQCPSCAQEVEIPVDAFGDDSPAQARAPTEHQVFACPSCQGKFGVTPDMIGKHVGCPHCQASVLVQIPEADSDPETIAPVIDVDRVPPKKSKKKKVSRRAQSENRDPSPDLFAPGFKPKQKKDSKPAAAKPPKKSDSAGTDATAGERTPPKPPPPPPLPPMPSGESDSVQGKSKQRWKSAKNQPPSKKQDRQRPAKPGVDAQKQTSKQRGPGSTPPASAKSSEPSAKSSSSRKPNSPPPTSKSESKKQDTPRKEPRFRELPAKRDNSKTKTHGFDATVEFEGELEEVSPSAPAPPARATPKPSAAETVAANVVDLPDTKNNIFEADVVDAAVVNANVVDSPPGNNPASKVDGRGPASPPDGSADKPPAQNDSGSVDSANSESDQADPPVSPEVDVAVEEVVPDGKEPIDHLLPPRFDVLDPSQLGIKSGKSQFKVLIPDGKGGMAQVDRRVVNVDHDGERVSLVVMTPEQKRRRRIIQNSIAILIGIIVMWLAFQMLK